MAERRSNSGGDQSRDPPEIEHAGSTPLRKIALNVARADTSLKVSLNGKRKYAGWNDAFMAMLMAG